MKNLLLPSQSNPIALAFCECGGNTSEDRGPVFFICFGEMERFLPQHVFMPILANFGC